jgi:aquaporin Z
MAKYLTELVGTFFLVLTVGLAVIGGGAGAMAPLAIGSALMVMVYAGGHLSGGHYNPAVSLAARLRGGFSNADLGSYWFFQLLGGVLATFVVQYLRPGASTVPVAGPAGPIFVAELLFTFALCWVVLNVATAKATSGNSYFGLAIGFTVMVGAFAAGNVSGGAFNPAVYVAGSILGLFSWANAAIYLGAQLLGGAGAALLFKAVHPK